MGEDNMKPKKKGNSLKTNSQVKRGALNPNKGQNNFDLPIFMCEKITLLENKTILPQIRNYNVHGQLTSQCWVKSLFLLVPLGKHDVLSKVKTCCSQ